MSSLTPIQQLVTAQRIATIQQISLRLQRETNYSVLLASNLSQEDNFEFIQSLNPENLKSQELFNLLAAIRYLTYYYYKMNFSENENYLKINKEPKLTISQLKVTILQLEREIKLIKLQKYNKQIALELCQDEVLLKKLKKELEEREKIIFSCF